MLNFCKLTKNLWNLRMIFNAYEGMAAMLWLRVWGFFSLLSAKHF